MSNVDTMGWGEHVAYLRETFINGLVARGYRLTRDMSDGPHSDTTLTSRRVTVTLGAGFPYFPPQVTAVEGVPRSWHQDAEGILCLYASSDRERQPWLDPDNLHARIEGWFTKNEHGWPGDPPALDLEAYLDLPFEGRIVLYSQIDRLVGEYIRLTKNGATLRTGGSGRLPRKSNKGLISGFVTDVGQLDQPLHTWNEIVDASADAIKIRTGIERGRLEVLLVRYQRRDQHGVIGLTFTCNTSGAPTVRRAFVASEDPSTLALRAGTTYNSLKTKHVYLIGAGALGSYIADGLVRAGIGRLTVRDGDIFLPGNTTRHLVAYPGFYGSRKADVVAQHLKQQPYNRAHITGVPKSLTDPADAPSIFENVDLVLDATADGALTAMLTDAAYATGHRFVTACIQNEGNTQRVDVVPPLDGTDPLPATIHRPPTVPEAFEAGCGEPVSPTPPHAVIETAAMAIRHAIGHLTGNPPNPAGELRDL